MEETTSTEPAQATSTTSANFSVPEAYASKTWAQEISRNENPNEALWKMLDNSQSMIGKKVFAPPADDAPQEEWDKFINTLRPESPDKYAFSPIEGLPEGLDLKESQKKASEIFHKHGLTKKQADAIYQEYVRDVLGQQAKLTAQSAEQQAQLDKQFDEVTKQYFGDQYDIKAASAMEFIASKIPEGLRASFKDAESNPKLLAGMIAIIDAAQNEISAVKKQYGAEGSLNTGEAVGGKSIEEVRRELASLRVSQEYKDFTNPKNKETVNRVNALSEIVKRSLKSG